LIKINFWVGFKEDKGSALKLTYMGGFNCLPILLAFVFGFAEL
jgi:hypothetical protein